ncbi:cilia- and flagella-associated protein 54-like isoform X2 [Bolinopsis microptera]|uniref:cilia- and flagella-associated protein 54-like isoform X2 n=1 Tax=Bolinopsis microptera TaxID=2820187 RepID=UPI0030798A6F
MTPPSFTSDGCTATLWETLKILYTNNQFEKLAYIGTRFNQLTNDVFGEQTYPLIIYSKRKLVDRVAEYNEPWHTETSSVSIRSTVTPVQAAHENISPQIVEALRLCSVPLDLEVDQEALASVLSVRSHTALSLQYCRQLLLCYLAGYGKGNLKPSSSPVSSFHPGTAGASKLYDKPGDLFVSPLSTSSYGIIVSTYEKTIEMLQVKGKTDLAVQAMHELGNVLFHSGNTKGAFKWWCDALDTLLHMTNSMQNWHSFTPETLLNKCQIWGCLLGACIASNISQYIVSHSVDDKVDACLLSAQLFKALFHASLPHPASDYQYVNHEIGEGFNIPALIPGVDLLSDQFRCSASVLVGSLHYVSETLVRHQFASQALPVLSLYHYVAMSLLSDTKHLILARILKVEALTQLSMLTDALQLWSLVSQTEAMPTPPTSHGNNISNKTNVPEYNITEPLNSTQNVQAVEHAIKCKIPPIPQPPFTTNLSALAQLAHAGLMLAIAQRSSVVPMYSEGSESQTTESAIKYKLCNSAEVILMHLSKCADKEDAHYCEIEIGVSSRRLLCTIALEKQLGATIVNLSNYGLSLLQRSYQLDRQEVVSYDEMCSKRRLDSLAWLQLKCAMIQGFGLMTTMYGANDCKQICAATKEESQLFNSSEMQAWISLKDLVLDINASNTFQVERQIKEGLSRMVAPSCLGASVSVGTILYCASRATNKEDSLSRLRKVRELLEYQHEQYYGNKHNIHTYMAPVSALAVVLETDWKLSELSERILAGDEVSSELDQLEQVLSSTLTHSNVGVATRAELLIRLGVVMRGKWEIEPTPERFVALINTLCECVSATNFNLPIAREAYLEIAYVTAAVTNNNNSDATAAKQVTLEKRATWSAIRSAALCNISQESLKCLEQNPASQAIVSKKDIKRLPSFTGLELNRELSTKLLHPQSKTQQPQPPSNLSWVKLLSYLETLKRDLQTQGFSGQCPMSSPGLSGKITVLQDYLASTMPGWSKKCNIPTISRNISYLTMGRVLAGTPNTTVSSRESSSQPAESVAPSDSASEGGVVLQWVTPRLVTRVQDSTKDTLAFYAFNIKPVKTSSPMFTSNSFTGFKAVSSASFDSLHTKIEYAHARAVIEDDAQKKEGTPLPPGSAQPQPPASVHPPSSRASTKTSFSPEPYEPGHVKTGVVESLGTFLGLDPAVTKDVLEQPDSLSSEKLSILENLFTVTSVPQNQTELCRWLLSFKKVLPKAAAGGVGSKRATPGNKEPAS